MKNRAYEITGNCKFDEYQRALASMVYKIFDKKTVLGESVNKKLAKRLHKPVVKKLKKRKVYAIFKDSLRASYLTEMESLYCRNKNVNCLLCVIDVFNKYAWVKPLKYKTRKTVLDAFMEIVN